jgi:hypothetical protein
LWKRRAFTTLDPSGIRGEPINGLGEPTRRQKTKQCIEAKRQQGQQQYLELGMLDEPGNIGGRLAHAEHPGDLIIHHYRRPYIHHHSIISDRPAPTGTGPIASGKGEGDIAPGGKIRPDLVGVGGVKQYCAGIIGQVDKDINRPLFQIINLRMQFFLVAVREDIRPLLNGKVARRHLSADHGGQNFRLIHQRVLHRLEVAGTHGIEHPAKGIIETDGGYNEIGKKNPGTDLHTK